jgi:hypothetical protein
MNWKLRVDLIWKLVRGKDFQRQWSKGDEQKSEKEMKGIYS